MSVKLMMGVLRELENTPATSHKEELLKVAGSNIPHFKDMLRYALDPYKKYGIATYTLDNNDKAVNVPKWEDIQQLLDSAANRQLTGLALSAQIQNFLRFVGPSGRQVFRRVLLKDLRCGVGATLVNRVFPHLIPEFGIMLANPLMPHHARTLKKAGKAWWQAKKNGDRMVAMIPPGQGTPRAYSRKGHELHNYDQVLTNLKFVLDQSEQYKDVGLVFDGEIIMADFWGTRGVKKLKGNEAKGAVYHIFDMVSLPMWEEQTSLPYRLRRTELAKIGNSSSFGLFQNLARVPSYPIDLSCLVSDKTFIDYFDGLRDKLTAQGEEGVMIRPDGPYNYKSRASMMKHKKMDTMDCTIMEILPGDEGKKYADTAGRVLVRLDDGETLCYAGLKKSDAERAEMWKNRNLLAGKTCEVAYQSKTVSKDGIAKLQFPVFLRIREDKS